MFWLRLLSNSTNMFVVSTMILKNVVGDVRSLECHLLNTIFPSRYRSKCSQHVITSSLLFNCCSFLNDGFLSVTLIPYTITFCANCYNFDVEINFCNDFRLSRQCISIVSFPINNYHVSLIPND